MRGEDFNFGEEKGVNAGADRKKLIQKGLFQRVGKKNSKQNGGMIASVWKTVGGDRKKQKKTLSS